MSAVLALAASLGYGLSDFTAGVLARRLPPVLIAYWSQVLGTLAFVAAAAGSGQRLELDGAAWGLGAGVVAAVALLLFYRALARGKASVVAPIAATGTLVPVAVQTAGGDPPSTLALLGVPLAVGGLVLLARSTAEDELPETRPAPGRRALPLAQTQADDDAMAASVVAQALGSAAGFGLFFVLFDAGTAAAPGAELWVIAAVLAGALPTTLAAALRERASLAPALALLPIVAVALFDLGGDAALTFALAEGGDLATVGVLASLDPLVTVLLAMTLRRERLERLQGLGAVACLAGVVLIATG